MSNTNTLYGLYDERCKYDFANILYEMYKKQHRKEHKGMGMTPACFGEWLSNEFSYGIFPTGWEDKYIKDNNLNKKTFQLLKRLAEDVRLEQYVGKGCICKARVFYKGKRVKLINLEDDRVDSWEVSLGKKKASITINFANEECYFLLAFLDKYGLVEYAYPLCGESI